MSIKDLLELCLDIRIECVDIASSLIYLFDKV